jgi:hypothetical protein
MKVLKKRMDKRSLKMLEKSELEVQIENEEEKRALNLSEAVLSKIDSMRFTFPFLSNMLAERRCITKLFSKSWSPKNLN